VKTSAIMLRVADFLKAYPPFRYLPEESLLDVARSGRVRCEPHDQHTAAGEAFLTAQIFVRLDRLAR